MPFEAHRKGQEQNKYRYLALMATLQQSGAEISLGIAVKCDIFMTKKK